MNLGDNWYLILFALVVVALGAIYFAVFRAKYNSGGGSLMNPNEDDHVTEDEIKSMVNEGHEQGNIRASEAEMINNILELEEKDARDIMNHRTNIVAISADESLEAALDFMLGTSHTRFPVFEDDNDNIIGILNIRDAFIYSRNPENVTKSIKSLKGLIRNASFIPETRDINTLFKFMQSNKEHMVIVVDEYGQTAGIIAMEDILEEIVGNIQDEFDNEPEMISEQQDGVYIMDGMTPLREAFETLDIEMTEELEEYDTLNGMIISFVEHIPEADEDINIAFGGYNFKVLSVENKRIHEVEVHKQKC